MFASPNLSIAVTRGWGPLGLPGTLLGFDDYQGRVHWHFLNI